MFYLTLKKEISITEKIKMRKVSGNIIAKNNMFLTYNTRVYFYIKIKEW